MDNNYLFLKMQTGGQLSPEQLQRAQQMGQLPQMGMGAGLTDIQKMNMQQAEHYGMFRKGGVPKKYAQGGEQEEIDQQFLSPYTKYNQRVTDFLENLKSTAMGALQDEMVGVNDDYAQEAEEIEMEQAQYGQEVSQPTVNPQGMAAVNSWMGAAQNTKDMIEPLTQTAGLATGLKGYFGGDQASYEANPYNAAWNPTRLTTTNKATGEKTVTRAGRDGFAYGGQYFEPGGEKTTPTAEEVKKAEEEKKKAEADAKAKEEAKTTATTETKKNTGEIDYLASLADPTSQNAGGVYRTDKSGNPVPMAFYDPNMRLNTMTPTYRNNVASWLRGDKKHGQLKSVVYDFTTGTQSPATQVPSITDPNAPNDGIPEGTSTITNPDGTKSSVAPDFYERNFPAPKIPIWDPSQFIPKYNAPSPPAIAPQAPQQPTAPQPMSPGAAWNPQDFLPTSLRAAQQAPLNAQQQAQLAKLNQGAKGATAGSSYSPAALSSNPAGTIVQGNDGNFYFQDANGQTHSSNNQNSLTQKRDGLGLTGKRNGGQYFGPGGENQEVLGLTPNPQMDMGWAPLGQEKRAPQDRVDANLQMAQDFNKQQYGEPLKINDTDSFTAKYDKNKKNNPFFAPTVLAGLDTIAGAAQNMDAKKKENQLRGKLSYDQIYSANPETSGSRGDWTFNEGYMRPNDMVPTQFTGNGMQTAQWGGAYAEGDELYLDEDAIQAFLQAGGQLDYLD